MKVVVTDACIFIDVIELQLTSRFFNLDVEIHTTADVLMNFTHLNSKFSKATRQAIN
jgi:hypothetical protein